jgi:hypothetical protein
MSTFKTKPHGLLLISRHRTNQSTTSSSNVSKTATIMRTQLSATILLSCMANTAICDLGPAKRNSKLFGERDTFTGGDYLAHDNCTATMTSCNWVSDITPVTGCCPFSTVCDGIGGGGYCCPTCKIPLPFLNDWSITDGKTADDCGPSVDSIPRCADLSWSLWLGSGTGTHSIDGDTILPKYYCCLADEIGLMNDTCVANTVLLAAGEKATLVSSLVHFWVSSTASLSFFPVVGRTLC